LANLSARAGYFGPVTVGGGNMRRTAFVFFCLLSAIFIPTHAEPAAQRAKSSSGTMCKSQETALFDCSTPDKVSSICQNGKQVAFRYGWWWDRTEVEVVSNGHDGRAHRNFGRLGSNSNGIGSLAHQRSMRFSWRNVDFIAFATKWNNRPPDSGLVIEKDGVQLSNLRCRITRHPGFDGPAFVDDETDRRHQGVY